MKSIQILIFLMIVYDVTALKCHRCGLVENIRCEKIINLPTSDCDEPLIEDKEKFAAKAICIKTIRNIQKSNQTFYDRMCGFNEYGKNGTCEFLKSMYEDSINFSCLECDKDFCNGTRPSNVSIIALIVKTLSILFMKLF